jgi:hypothetical protein
MFEKIITFITPGSLSERFGFRARVFTSWISLGLALGLILGIITLSSGVATPNGQIALILQYIIGFPITICLFGLIGLGLNSMRGGDAEHPGWYWYLFPIVTYIVIGFWLTFAIIGFGLALAGVNLPQPRYTRQPTGRRVNPKEAQEKIRREVKRQQSKKFLDEYEDMLMKLQQEEMERLQRERLEEQEKKERLEYLSIRERILLKIRENSGALLEDILTEDEMEELALMILEASL